ncbi:MAG: DUF4143 domain-containing protein [Thermoplasmata archaeon]|nr:DUF4143 domain-containing protein [Thermoplasmata archaeon]
MTLTPEGYMPRLIDEQMEKYMRTFGAVCVEGPMWCGKTWMARNHVNSEINISDERLNLAMSAALEEDPRISFKGESPRLIDEWQLIPRIWDGIRNEVDRSRESGRFVLSGSSTPLKDRKAHSGAGRIGSLRMHTMSLLESKDSTGEVSLSGMFDKKEIGSEPVDMTLEDMAYLMIRGGWPYLIGASEETAVLANLDYIDKTVKNACRLDDATRRDAGKMEMLIKSLGRNESTVASGATILSDIEEYEDDTVSEPTMISYTDILKRMFVIENQPSFASSIRDPDRVGKSPKRRLADPSMAIAAMRMGPERLLGDPRTYGLMFESLCARDLRIYAETIGGSLFHYRDNNGREVDAVVELPDGRWGAFEIKTRSNKTDEAAESLKKVAKYFENQDWTPPTFLCVICATAPAAYTRQDGVHVVPITTLKP